MRQVPGEMFALALEAKARGMGVVGSTQNILDFIAGKLSEALERPFPERLQARCRAAAACCVECLFKGRHRHAGYSGCCWRHILRLQQCFCESAHLLACRRKHVRYARLSQELLALCAAHALQWSSLVSHAT